MRCCPTFSSLRGPFLWGPCSANIVNMPKSAPVMERRQPHIMLALCHTGYTVLSVWSWRICSPDSLSWNVSFIIINLVQVLVIASRMRPICLTPQLAQLYNDVFRPLRMSRSHFLHIIRRIEGLARLPACLSRTGF